MPKITKKVNTYEVEAYVLNKETVPPTIETKRISVLDLSMSERKARAAFAETGIMLPKGTTFAITELEGKTYSVDFEKFMEIAEVED